MQFFLDDQAHSRTDNMSTSGYEVIERTNPYSDYQSLNEYDMMSDFHSNILHESLNPDINHSISDSTSETKGASKLEHQSINKEPPSTNKKGSDLNTQINIPPTQSYLPHNAKPVYRKTPVPSRRIGGKSGDHLTVLSYLQQDSATSPTLATGILMDEQPTNISVSPRNKCSRDVEAASEHVNVPETGKQLCPSNVCCDLDDALSVYDVYTIP